MSNLSDGLYRDSGYLPRASSSNGSLVSYTMFTDAARSNRWGNTYDFDGVSGTGNGAAQFLTVYGRVPANQSVAPGLYTDTVLAIMTY